MKRLSAIYRTALACVAVATIFGFADPALRNGAHAQLCPPSYVTFVMRDGKRVHVFYCQPRWTGMSGDQIDGGGDILDEKRVQTGQRQPAFARSAVRFICPSEDCPADIKTSGAKQDTVVWKDGSRTTGRLEVKCSGPCRVLQDGKPVHAAETANAWNLGTTVSYIELADPSGR